MESVLGEFEAERFVIERVAAEWVFFEPTLVFVRYLRVPTGNRAFNCFNLQRKQISLTLNVEFEVKRSRNPVFSAHKCTGSMFEDGRVTGLNREGGQIGAQDNFGGSKHPLLKWVESEAKSHVLNISEG